MGPREVFPDPRRDEQRREYIYLQPAAILAPLEILTNLLYLASHSSDAEQIQFYIEQAEQQANEISSALSSERLSRAG